MFGKTLIALAVATIGTALVSTDADAQRGFRGGGFHAGFAGGGWRGGTEGDAQGVCCAERKSPQ